MPAQLHYAKPVVSEPVPPKSNSVRQPQPTMAVSTVNPVPKVTPSTTVPTVSLSTTVPKEEPLSIVAMAGNEDLDVLYGPIVPEDSFTYGKV